MTIKTCVACLRTSEEVSFHGLSCSGCYDKLKRERNKSKTTDLNLKQKIQLAITRSKHPEKCSSCDKEFYPEKFKFDAANCRFRNPCVECFNTKKYYEKYREKRSAEDKFGFMKHNAEVQKQWRAKNPYHDQDWNNKRRQDAATKIKIVKSPAIKRKVNFCDDDYDILKSKLSLKCFYCNYISTKDLNGLDRVDNNMGYSADNTVPCCKTCNYMKHQHSTTTFIDHVLQILNFTQHYSSQIPTDENFNLPKTNFGTGRRKTVTKQKTTIMARYQKQNIELIECYLCGSTDNLGIDRIDSNVDYTDENCKSCCKTCNIMKKDFSLDEFLKHLIRIRNHQN